MYDSFIFQKYRIVSKSEHISLKIIKDSWLYSPHSRAVSTPENWLLNPNHRTHCQGQATIQMGHLAEIGENKLLVCK